MRPLRLDLVGFTVFRDPTTIDFTDADFFALVGPTGAGKSTVLDAICFALYGTVPRWGDRRAVASALAPSTTEARVRLAFESAGARYIATRVVRRDGKGRVATAVAGLQLMPAGFDVSKLDGALSTEDLGEVLAGTPAEMDAAVLEAVGLPYEQFTKCVVLPQGEFAEFLHAKPATRQQILVNLLGLHVYERVRERAGALAAAAEAQLAAVDRLLTDAADCSDEDLAAAAARVDELAALAAEVDAATPRLTEARRAVEAARAALAEIDAQTARLREVIPPAGLNALTEAVTTARVAANDARAQISAAEEREEKLRGELATAGDPAALRALLDAYAERVTLAEQEAAFDAAVAAAEIEQAAAQAALASAQAQADDARQALEAARAAYQEAQAADQAAALRAHLVVDQPCPVCTQPVTSLPTVAHSTALGEAEAAGKAARAALQRAEQLVTERDGAARELDRTLAAARAQRDQVAARRADLDARLAGAPSPEALRAELAAIAALRDDLTAAAAAVRAAREAGRQADTAVARAEQRLHAAWRDFDAARDAVAALGPPEADRSDLAAAWAALAGWAADRIAERQDARAAQVSAVEAAERSARAVAEDLAARFAAAGLAPPDTDHARAAAVALERARAEHERLADRRAQAERLRAQRAEHEREAQVARALAGHLRANNFERWLLAEALDLLVDGASRILRELSGGQYELMHDKGEFFVVDHHDAGLRRGVRTLSGGETFQASLALALALAEQLAGLSTSAASLESIVLDEGFGTLDAATLDAVAATLENLAARGDRMVGVVTHVTALAERIPVRFEVRKDARTARVERVG
ncbi:MAG: SMC family ATPase [Micromonosporaceae bacterium]